jgi:hypothetical protein
MTFRKSVFILCVITLVLCLAVGFEFTGQWIGSLIAFSMGPAWLIARKYPNSWLPVFCLLISISLAVVGKLTGGSSLLMIFGSGVSLAVWDLLSLDVALGSNVVNAQSHQYENKHLQSLALALGFGLLVAFLGHSLNLEIPFFVLILFIVFTLFGLDRIWNYIKKRSDIN